MVNIGVDAVDGVPGTEVVKESVKQLEDKDILPAEAAAAAAAAASASPEPTQASNQDSKEEAIKAKLAQAKKLKDEGNGIFAKGDPKSALRKYWEAVLNLEGLAVNPMQTAMGGNEGADEPDEEKDEKKLQLSMIHSNMAACYLKLENGKRALEASSKALTHNANNTKASYRHALAQITLKEHYKAQAELQVLLKKSNISASEKPLIERELSDLDKFLKAKLEKERKGLKGFLGAGLGNGPAVAIDPKTTKPEEEEEEEEEEKGQQQQRLSAKAKGKQRAQ